MSSQVSADLAPDLLVPWRHPTLTIVYAVESIALDDAGLMHRDPSRWHETA